MSQYLYFSPRLDGFFTLTTDALEGTTERHHLTLGVGESMTGANPLEVVRGLNGTGAQDGINGIVIAMASGLPDRQRLEVIEAALTRGLRAWLYWPAEQAVECVDRERLREPETASTRGYRAGEGRTARPPRHEELGADEARSALDLSGRVSGPALRHARGPRASQPRRTPRSVSRTGWSARHIAQGGRGPVPADGLLGADHLGRQLRPHLLRREGTGGASPEHFVCLLAQPFKLLDDLGVSQVVMDAADHDHQRGRDRQRDDPLLSDRQDGL